MDNYEKQQGLNEVVAAKVHRMIESNKSRVNQTIARLTNEVALAADFIAPVGTDNRKPDPHPQLLFTEQGYITLQTPDRAYSLHNHALGQLAERIGIPPTYLRRLAEGSYYERKLATTILNEHTGWMPRSRLLVRTVGPQVRGVLSDSYLRLNSMQIVMAFLYEVQKHHGVICDALMTDTKIFIETILPQPIHIDTPQNGTVVVYLGARLSTSDYGDGKLDLRTYLLNGVCLNGMVRESVMKRVHLGSKLPADLGLSEQTYRLETQAQISALKDLTQGIYGEQNIEQKRLEIASASATTTDLDAALGRLVKANRLRPEENTGIQKLLINNDPEDGLAGAATLWKLTQSINAYARVLAPERGRELQELSGDLLATAA